MPPGLAGLAGLALGTAAGAVVGGVPALAPGWAWVAPSGLTIMEGGAEVGFDGVPGTDVAGAGVEVDGCIGAGIDGVIAGGMAGAADGGTAAGAAGVTGGGAGGTADDGRGGTAAGEAADAG